MNSPYPTLNFGLGEDIDMLRDAVYQMCQKEIVPRAADIDRSNEFPMDLWRTLGDMGLLGITIEDSYGGSGMGYLAHSVVMEEISRASASVGLSYGAMSNLCLNQLGKNGNEEQKQKYLPKLCSGQHIGALAMSEANAGSDVVSMTLNARKQGDSYILNGTKMWITNSTQADYICLLANTSDDQKHRNKSLIVVPTDTPGFSTSKRLNKLGMRASDTAQLFFDDVVVPQRYLIGEEGKGFTYQMMQFQEERLAATAICIKGLENCIRDTVEYTSQRQAFGKPLLDNQIINMKLADMQMEVEALRALTYRTCEMYINGEDPTLLASYSKLKAGKLCNSIPTECLQFWGGMGYMWDNPVGRAMRDMRLTSIGGGADEVMLGIIGKRMGLMAK